MGKLNYSLQDLCRTLDQRGDDPLREAHARLDDAVRAAYGMPDNADPLSFLFHLNLICAAKENAGEKVTPPGLRLPDNGDAVFITGDCIQPLPLRAQTTNYSFYARNPRRSKNCVAGSLSGFVKGMFLDVCSAVKKA